MQSYLTDGVERIVSEAIKAILRNPKESAFMLKFAAARYEGFASAIISKEIWDRIQALLEAKKETKVRASANKPFHRYTGPLKCSDCGCTLVAKEENGGTSLKE